MARGLEVLRAAIEERRGVRPAGTSDWLVWDVWGDRLVTLTGTPGALADNVFAGDWEIGPVIPRRFGKVPLLKILRECLGTSLSEGKTVIDRMEQEWPWIFTEWIRPSSGEERPTVAEAKAYWQTAAAQGFVEHLVDEQASFLLLHQLAARWPAMFREEDKSWRVVD